MIFFGQPSLPFVSPVFGDHMVLQRGQKDRIWGWTTPGFPVEISIAGKSGKTVADATGKWLISFDPPKPGGPYELHVSGPEEVTFKDVLVGDVWLCSGQSNMEIGITLAKNGAAEIASANEPNLRLFTVQHQASLTPMHIASGVWDVCSPTTVAPKGTAGFSSVAYFFGRSMQRKVGVPIGLIVSAWGGMPGEAFVSAKSLSRVKDFRQPLKQIEEELRPGAPSESERLAAWFAANDSGSSTWMSPDLDDSAWTLCPKLGAYDFLGLGTRQGNDFYARNGVVWFRKKFKVPQELVGRAGKLTLSYVGDVSSVWLNGRNVGETINGSTVKHYEIPGGFQPGDNTLVVRVLTNRQWGGFFYNGQGQLGVEYPDGRFFPLDLDWKYQLGTDLRKAAPLPVFFGSDPSRPTSIYNGMISPLSPLSLKGFLWYQGEANVGRADQYRQILATLIGDWRSAFQGSSLHFYVVQLANYLSRSADPVDDPWAQLRGAQSDVAQRLKNVGLAVTIDIGERFDIHPKNKQEVGKRLALLAMHDTYGLYVPCRGPILRSARREKAGLRLSFFNSHGLKFKGGATMAFAVAGPDQKFSWARAEIDGDSVVIHSSKVLNPQFVQYAWDADPEAPLYNSDDLPATPFKVKVMP